MATKFDQNEVPIFNNLLNPTLIAIKDMGGSASNTEIVNQVIENLSLSSDVSQIPHGTGSQTELEYRLGWVRTYLKQYGLINNSERAVWSLTALGRDTESINPVEIVRYVAESSRKGKQTNEAQDHSLHSHQEDFNDFSTQVDSWKEELVPVLKDMSPEAFERLCQRLLRESGFIEVQVTRRTGDGGIDGHGIIRLAGLISFPVVFQCKRYTGSVGPEIVQAFRGATQGRADKGLLLTTGTFTRGARQEATRSGTTPIDLIDGDLLMDKLKELKLGISTRMVEEVKVDADWFKSI